MGVDTRRIPPLPAATDSSTLPTSGDEIPTDLATDISRRTDRTSYSIPEDGSPITVRTSGKGDKISHRKDQSQTSLLIEYFEGGKGPNVHSRPSVRVKVTPSSAKKGKESKDHIQVTQTEGNRKPSYTRRISLGPREKGEVHVIDNESKSISSLAEDSNLSSRPPPIEVEVMHRDQESDLSGTSIARDNRNIAFNPSEISSMPPDSMLDERVTVTTPKRSRSRSLTRIATASTAAAVGTAAMVDTLKTPSRRHSRSRSREGLTRKVIEKLEAKEPRISSSKHIHSKSRSRSVSQEQLTESVGSPRRKSDKHRRIEELPSESSVVTGSQLSEARSYRSDASKSSVTNPKLLAAVESTIRRLIIPELNALKAEQKRQQTEHERRDSISSSRDGEVSRRASRTSTDLSVRGKSHREDSLKKKSRRHHDKYEGSPSERSFEREMSQETVVHDGDRKHKKRSKEGSHLKDAAAGAVVGGLLTHAALKHHDSSSTVDRKERRRKRSKSHSSHSVTNSIAGTEEIFNKHDVPPMPMRSELTTSDVTRDSILSEQTSTPSLTKRRTEIRQLAQTSPKDVYSPSQTPTRSPSGLRNSASYDNEYHDDYSQSNQSYEEEPHHYMAEAGLGGAVAGARLMAAHHAFGSHDTVTAGGYQHGRSLSPIQSVASYEERDELSRRNSKRQAAHVSSMSSLDKPRDMNEKHLSLDSVESYKPKARPEAISMESASEVLVGHDSSKALRDRQEEHEEHADTSWFEGDEGEGYRNSTGMESYDSSQIPIGHLTQYTDDSTDVPYLDKVTAAQEVRGVGANPEWVHTPLAVESAVASLHESSIMDGHSTKSTRSYPLESQHESPTNSSRQEYYREQREFKTGSPLKQRHDAVDISHDGTRDSQLTTESPRQSPPHSEQNRESIVKMTGSALPNPDDPMPEIMDVDSEISTNPTDIQGPKKYDTPIQWPYHQATPPQTRADGLVTSNNNSTHESLASAAKNMLGVAAAAGAAAAINQRRKAKDSFEDLTHKTSHEEATSREEAPEHGEGTEYTNPYGNVHEDYMPTSPRDEGYVTQQEQDRSVGALTPDTRRKGMKVPELFPDPTGGIGINGVGVISSAKDDPFMATDPRRISGNSHGMSPQLYDAATGQGIDRIQSKDVIALMDHVRCTKTFNYVANRI